jgi:LysM repeat protein
MRDAGRGKKPALGMAFFFPVSSDLRLATSRGGRWIWCLLLCLGLLLAAGCGGPGDETRHPRYQRAAQLREDGKYAAAATEWEEYLRRFPPAATRAHLELAQLYHDHLDDPFLAVYHYRRYLEANPETSDAETLRVFQQAAEKRYFEQLAQRHSPDAQWRQEALQLRGRNEQARKTIERLLAENRYLKEQSGVRIEAGDVAPTTAPPAEMPAVETVTAAPPTSPAVVPTPPPSVPVATAPPPAPPTETGRTYVVRDGDTLAKISREVYGSANHFQRIFEANRDQLPAPNQLQVGQTLRIPPLAAATGQ